MTAPSARVRRPDGFFERGHQVTRLEAFVDAAFAFTLTLLAISIDSVPGDRAELILAMKGVPAFAASFLIICLFWWNHNVWSRRYGLDDGVSVLLSLIFVFLILIYVYPLKLLFSSMFAWLSNGWLPSGYAIATVDDLVLMYLVYGAAFVSLGVISLLLGLHAYRRRRAIGLDPLECLLARRELWRGLWLPALGLLSMLATLQLDPTWPLGLALPGLFYFLLFGQSVTRLIYRQEERRLRQQLAETTANCPKGGDRQRLDQPIAQPL